MNSFIFAEMLVRTTGILIHQVRYSEKSLILKILTSDEGVQSFFLHNAGGKKSKGQGALQPLHLLEIVYRKDPGRDLQVIREFRLDHPYQNIGQDFLRNTVVLFLEEILFKSLRESGPQSETYHFIREWLISFDENKWNPSAHLYFLAELTAFLGFLPENNYSPANQYFDMLEGTFKNQFPPHQHVISPPSSENFSLLFQGTESPYQIRNEMLLYILEYYRLHIESCSGIKSLGVIRELMK